MLKRALQATRTAETEVKRQTCLSGSRERKVCTTLSVKHDKLGMWIGDVLKHLTRSVDQCNPIKKIKR